MAAVFLETLNWPEAEKVLRGDAPIVVPLGAALKEHGRHLPLNNDKLLASRLAEELAKRLEIVVSPIVEASYYPAFIEYPGSISLAFETASALIFETCAGLAGFGCQRIYVLNTGVSTFRVLQSVKDSLLQQYPHLKFAYTDFKHAVESASCGIAQQKGGGHADEVETSMMLYLAPQVVKMEKAECDFHGDSGGPLTRDVQRVGVSDAVYSPSGAWGDPTLASLQKGELIVNKLLDWLEKDIRSL